MTERSGRALQRDATTFAVGPSQLAWTGSGLDIELDERCTPLPWRVLGRVRLHPSALSRFGAALDSAGRHRWGPIAPTGRVEVDLQRPRLRWQGRAYFDCNEGDEPIERAFERWDWLRAPLRGGHCAVLYDVQARDTARRLIGARFAPDGTAEPIALAGPQQHLPATRWWRVDRRVPAETLTPHVVRTLEDTPFYARSLLDLTLDGQRTPAMHETLDVARLVSPVVQRLLPWRMPRVP
jgi:carotenoid 1,2-hydratase